MSIERVNRLVEMETNKNQIVWKFGLSGPESTNERIKKYTQKVRET